MLISLQEALNKRNIRKLNMSDDEKKIINSIYSSISQKLNIDPEAENFKPTAPMINDLDILVKRYVIALILMGHTQDVPENIDDIEDLKTFKLYGKAYIEHGGDFQTIQKYMAEYANIDIANVSAAAKADIDEIKDAEPVLPEETVDAIQNDDANVMVNATNTTAIIDNTPNNQLSNDIEDIPVANNDAVTITAFDVEQSLQQLRDYFASIPVANLHCRRIIIHQNIKSHILLDHVSFVNDKLIFYLQYNKRLIAISDEQLMNTKKISLIDAAMIQSICLLALQTKIEEITESRRYKYSKNIEVNYRRIFSPPASNFMQ